MKKHVNPAKHLHEVYTMQGVGGRIVDKIERREIKALKKRDDLC